ncbi:MAG TPA: VOC family protein [Thermoanaerobaculia bacterium]|nr:VOC family protein [Thermoanaerobaculia bacterium]
MNEQRPAFKVDQIDHVELFVPDRQEAARWYERTLGIAALPEHADWAADPGGPLMISSDGGATKLALFTGEPRRNRPTAGFHLVAFRVTGAGFLQFLEHVRDHPVYDDEGDEIRSLTPRDHHKAFSVYFNDPWGHRLEVTTYEAEHVRERLMQTTA